MTLNQVAAPGVLIMDGQGVVRYANIEFDRLTGLSGRELIGQSLDAVITTHFLGHELEPRPTAAGAMGSCSSELMSLRLAGRVEPLMLSLLPVADNSSDEGKTVALFFGSDDVAYSHPHIDLLTGLPSRTLLEEHLAQALTQASLHHKRVCVYHINLLGFKNINFNLGYAAGDWLLKQVALRLQVMVRDVDTLARPSADNFVLVTPDVLSLASMSGTAAQLCDELSKPWLYHDSYLNLEVAIGISVYPDDGLTQDVLLRHAETAMMDCRKIRRYGFRFYTPDINLNAEANFKLGHRLRDALQNEQLILYYQPQIDLQNGKIVGMEALIRWQDGDEVIPPDAFISVAEGNGLILPLGRWIFKSACLQAKQWHEQGYPIKIAVNVSAVQFRDPNMTEYITNTLKEVNFPPAFIELEITESVLMDDPDDAANKLAILSRLGLEITVDDFGTAYSSLNYLKTFPLNKLKIDKSFIFRVLDNGNDAVIVRGIIAMGHALGLTIIAEGVENAEQMRYLRSLGCDHIQGYLFSPPLTTKHAEEFLHQGVKMEHYSSDVVDEHILLIVDDEPSIIKALKRTLRSEPYLILGTTSPQQALDLLNQHKIGVVVSDYKMPGMSGIDLLGDIKVRFPWVVRILLSGHADREVLSHAINAGEVFHFLEKPWDDNRIKMVIRQGFNKFDAFNIEQMTL